MGASTGQQPAGVRHSSVVIPVATATSSTTSLARMPYTGTIVSVSYVPNAAITGANTNTRRLSLVNKGTNGAGNTEAAALQFDSGVNAPAFAEKALTNSGTPANLDVAEGAVLAWVSAAVGTGLADPGGVVIVQIARD